MTSPKQTLDLQQFSKKIKEYIVSFFDQNLKFYPWREQKSTPKTVKILHTLFSHACAIFRNHPSNICKKQVEYDPP